MQSQVGSYRITLFSGGDIVSIWKTAQYLIKDGTIYFEDHNEVPVVLNGTYMVVREF